MGPSVQNSTGTLSLPVAKPSTVLSAYPTIGQKIDRALALNRPLHLIGTDIDNTLHLGAGHPSERQHAYEGHLKEVVCALNRAGVIIVPVTGSHYDSGTPTTPSVRDRIAQGVLPGLGGKGTDDFYVDALVTDGGTKLLAPSAISLPHEDADYRRLAHPQYSVAAVQSKLENEMQSINAEKLSTYQVQIISSYDPEFSGERMVLQPGTIAGVHQKSGKLALHFYASNLHERDVIERKFHETFPELRIVCCEEKDANNTARRTSEYLAAENSVNHDFPLKYCLDLVPVDKAVPVEYFKREILAEIGIRAAALGIASHNVPPLVVWFSGDAGNDLNGVRSAAVDRVIMVGGSSPELTRWTEFLEGMGKRVYVESSPVRHGPLSILEAFRMSGILD